MASQSVANSTATLPREIFDVVNAHWLTSTCIDSSDAPDRPLEMLHCIWGCVCDVRYVCAVSSAATKVNEPDAVSRPRTIWYGTARFCPVEQICNSRLI